MGGGALVESISGQYCASGGKKKSRPTFHILGVDRSEKLVAVSTNLKKKL